MLFFFFKQKTAYEMRISDWSSDGALPICAEGHVGQRAQGRVGQAVRDRGAEQQPLVPGATLGLQDSRADLGRSVEARATAARCPGRRGRGQEGPTVSDQRTAQPGLRAEESRAGKACGRTARTRGSQYH